MTNSSFLVVKILWRRSTETEIAFGERRSPAASLRMALHAHRMRPERTGFSPSASARISRRARRPFAACALRAPAFCCTRLKSAKNLYLSHRFFCKIRQIHRFFCIFRQKLQILCRNQARESWGKSRRKLEQSRRVYEPEMHTKSEQKYSDKARRTGKSLRRGEKIRQNHSDLMHFSGCS